MTWTLEQALPVVEAIQGIAHVHGYHTGVSGSVLHKGHSTKDLDIVVYPLTTEQTDYDNFCRSLVKVGFVRLERKEHVHARWALKGSKDTKHVERWRSPCSRRIDLFFLS